jgi:hypothetical protein
MLSFSLDQWLVTPCFLVVGVPSDLPLSAMDRNLNQWRARSHRWTAKMWRSRSGFTLQTQA